MNETNSIVWEVKAEKQNYVGRLARDTALKLMSKAASSINKNASRVVLLDFITPLGQYYPCTVARRIIDVFSKRPFRIVITLRCDP